MDLLEVPSWKLFMYSSILSPSFGRTVVRFGMKKTSWIGEISRGMIICSKSGLYIFERCMRSCIQSDVKCISEVVCFPFAFVFVKLNLIHPQFLEGLLLLPLYISIGAIFSPISIASVGVNFIALRKKLHGPSLSFI